MTISKHQNGDTLEVSVRGRLDTATSPQLEDELLPALDDVRHLVLDFSELDYISSAGLRVLFQARKALYGTGDVTVKNANEIVRKVFSVTDFENIIRVE